MTLPTWFNRLLGWGSGKSVRKRPMRQMLSRCKRIVPRLEHLEDRLAPATYAWGGNDTALRVHLRHQ